MPHAKTVLGLDLGVTSVGWALLTTSFDEEGSIISREITDAGVRIFPATTEDKTNAPKNHKRRTSRGQRRLVMRKAQRRNDLRAMLADNGLFACDRIGDIGRVISGVGRSVRVESTGIERKADSV
ncbi:MAG: hypothetical protein IPP63_17770 [Chloracidobacterium sp.]|nr:hypothetical protein [Chloracidobacterium sp.]